MNKFKPKIVAFCCNYCAYAAADLAGVSRMQYPTNARIIRVPCSGKVDITYILRAFESGADGVVVAGCLKGGCHFVEGNLHAEIRVKFTKELLEAVGISSERLEMYFISTSMAPQFVEMVKEMTDKILKMGPAFPKRVNLTKKLEKTNKREFLYTILMNLARKKPEKPIQVPEGLEEFGSVKCNIVKCIGCKKCEEACPEKAIEFINEFDLPSILRMVDKEREGNVKKRQLIFKTLARIAVKPPLKAIPVPKGFEEFGKMRYLPEKCAVCDKCNDICPEKAISILKEVDLPEIFSSCIGGG